MSSYSTYFCGEISGVMDILVNCFHLFTGLESLVNLNYGKFLIFLFFTVISSNIVLYGVCLISQQIV